MISEYNAKRYCCEDISKIENYEQANADTEMWQCHHRLEVQGQFTNSYALLKKCGMYYKVPASQLIFVTKSMHNKIHNTAEVMLSKTTPERRLEIVKKAGKKGSQVANKKRKGWHFWNNRIECRYCKECPEGFVQGRLTKK